MEEKFERIEKHLYRRQYQTAGGDSSMVYYAIFTDWKGIRRKFPLGDDLESAKDRLGELRRLNRGRYDFDQERVEREKEKAERERAKNKAMTIWEWLDRYLDLTKPMKSWKTKKAQCAPLKRLLGCLLLSEINRVRIMEYKTRRLSEPLVRYVKKELRPVEGTKITGSTVNKEIRCLSHALNLAAEEGLCEAAPRIKKEEEIARERTLSATEYKALLNSAPRWIQRVMIAANEAALDRGVLINLTWDSVKDDLIKVSGGRAKTGARQRVGISPALQDVLDELRAEYRRIPNTERRVFTKGGKPISKETLRHAFEKAVRDAKIEDFQFRDFRHCARTRWAAIGLPFEVAEIGLGHKLRGMAGRYTNLSDDHIRDAFQKMATQWQHEKSGFAVARERTS